MTAVPHNFPLPSAPSVSNRFVDGSSLRARRLPRDKKLPERSITRLRDMHRADEIGRRIDDQEKCNANKVGKSLRNRRRLATRENAWLIRSNTGQSPRKSVPARSWPWRGLEERGCLYTGRSFRGSRQQAPCRARLEKPRRSVRTGGPSLSRRDAVFPGEKSSQGRLRKRIPTGPFEDVRTMQAALRAIVPRRRRHACCGRAPVWGMMRPARSRSRGAA